MHKIADIFRSWVLRIVIGGIIVLLLSIIIVLINTLFLRVSWLPLLRKVAEDGDNQPEAKVLCIPWLPVEIPFKVCLWHWCLLIKVC